MDLPAGPQTFVHDAERFAESREAASDCYTARTSAAGGVEAV